MVSIFKAHPLRAEHRYRFSCSLLECEMVDLGAIFQDNVVSIAAHALEDRNHGGCTCQTYLKGTPNWCAPQIDSVYFVMITHMAKPDGLPEPGITGSYVCVFPSIVKKECPVDDTWVRDLYAKYPDADYYTQHASTGKRAKPGTYQIYHPRDDRPGIINMFIRVYPNNKKVYPNDNYIRRQIMLKTILGDLKDEARVARLSLEFPTEVKTEIQEYLLIMEDYMRTAQLGGSKVNIVMYGEAVEKKEICIAKKPKRSAGISSASLKPVKMDTEGEESRTVSKCVLDFKPEQLMSQTLFEVDIVRYTIAQELSGIMQYFPDGWDRITSDSKLLKLAETVTEKLQPIIDDPATSAKLYPPMELVFNAFTLSEVAPRVVIVGQDPYHGKGQAHGLSFSVTEKFKIPPSLANVFKALSNDPDVEFTKPSNGCLTRWAEQGVILLNTALTVIEKTPKAHVKIWQPFTDRLIELLSQKYHKVVFVLWGTPARSKKDLISSSNGHLILEYNHPSPMVRNNKFATECRHFSQINNFLEKQGFETISW